MSTSAAFVLSLVWITLLLGTAVYNFAKKRTTLFYSSVFVLTLYALGHFINVQWLMPIPAIELIKVHYLFFSGAQILLALGLFLLNRKDLTHMMSLAILLLGLEAILIYAVHIDRNVVALNFNATPNLADSRHWFLWDLKNFASTLNNLFVIAAVALHKVYQVPSTPEEGDALARELEEYVSHWPDSARKTHILEYLEEAQKAFNFWTPDGISSRTDIGLTFLKDAVQTARYEPGCQNLTGFKKALYWLRS